MGTALSHLQKEHEEDWDDSAQRKQPRMHLQNTQQPQPQNAQCPQLQNAHQPQPQNTQPPHSLHTQCPQPQNNENSQVFDIPDRYVEYIKERKEWDERIKRLNEKYNLDYYSSLESETNSEPEYRYEHKYETLI